MQTLHCRMGHSAFLQTIRLSHADSHFQVHPATPYRNICEVIQVLRKICLPMFHHLQIFSQLYNASANTSMTNAEAVFTASVIITVFNLCRNLQITIMLT